ncbi:hypothetical protein Taro_051521 [Colocasia esculenta]|uniref:CP12 domain-containing protein n=1 Tax=Colocasia esculenta TaxID=4460 RepID=A0A843XH02_COLES|nr:hypothetical protein [Colocasia esculenta]
MASTALIGPNSLFPPSSPRRHPAAWISVVAALPRRSPLSTTPLLPLRWSSGRDGSSSCQEKRDLRAMAAVRRYKGTKMREKRLAEMIEQKVLEAKEVCEGDDRSDECKVAWDEVEEVSQAKADLRRRLAEAGRDPLESFCQENPEKDECGVVYDD